MNPRLVRVALAIGFLGGIAFLLFLILMQGCGGVPPEPPITIVNTCARDAAR